MARKLSEHELLLARALRSTTAELEQTIQIYRTVLKSRVTKEPTERKPRAPRGSKKVAEDSKPTDSDAAFRAGNEG